MKFGKEFSSLLSDSHFPEEWKSSAIEYRQLKKLIKDVVSELSSMGLSPDVLNKLLITEDGTPSGTSASNSDTIQALPSPDGSTAEVVGTDGDVFEFEFESDEASPPSIRATPISSPDQRDCKQLPAGPMSTGSASIPHTPPALISRSMEAGPSTLSQPQQRKFRVRLLSESNSLSPGPSRIGQPTPGDGRGPTRPMSVSGMMKDNMGTEASPLGTCLGESLGLDGGSGFERHMEARGRKVIRRSMNQGARVKAEYLLGGDSQHPQPQLVLHLPAQPDPASRTSSSTPSSRSENPYSDVENDTEEDEEDYSQSVRRTGSLLRSAVASPATIRPRRSPPISGSSGPGAGAMPPSPTLERVTNAMSPIFALASGASIDDGLHALSLGDSAIAVGGDHEDERYLHNARSLPPSPPTVAPLCPPPDREEQRTLVSSPPHGRDRDFVIPLTSDQAFFDLLTTALTSLSAFHADQQENFRQSVTSLCLTISQSIQPSSGGSTSSRQSSLLIPASSGRPPSTPIPATNPLTHSGTAKPNTKDLYAWREIFTLWIEAEIFESSAERTRGERTVEQAEARLQNFAAEVIKRGLGDRRTLRGKKVRGAWEEFLRLNVLLLDLKRFQMANINAARKILKKHDKRTALTASSGFQSFVRSTLSAVGTDGNITTWTFYNTSLPHVLLASLTDTLLPILPSLDDYACLICTSIAFKPIRLSCQHLFCVRCLVKMQRAGKEECPLCRSKVLLQADKSSLDVQVMDFMREWFPKEVKAKQKENEQEINRELVLHAQSGVGASGGGEKCLIM